MDLGEATDYVAKIYKKHDEPDADDYLSRVVYEGSTPIVDNDIVRLFKVLLAPIKPREILEIGMNVGFSTTHLALIAKQYGGKVTTIEYNPEVIEPARESFEREGMLDYIEILLGDAKELVPEVKSERFDVVFQDSAKCLYEPLLDDCVRILKPNGLLLVDDTLWPVLRNESEWNTDYRCLDSFNKAVASRDDLVSTILPIGEGFTIAVKK